MKWKRYYSNRREKQERRSGAVGAACGIQSGRRPSAIVDYQERLDDLAARLVVCADGRGSLARKWANFSARHESYRLLLAGVLFEGMPGVSPETNYWFLDSNAGHFAFLCPQRNGMVRACVWHPREWDYRYQQRQEELPRFVEDRPKRSSRMI